MPPMTDILAELRIAITELRDPDSDPLLACEATANRLALLHDSLEAGHKRSVDALVAEDRLEEMRADALRNGSFYDQDEDDSWEPGL